MCIQQFNLRYQLVNTFKICPSLTGIYRQYTFNFTSSQHYISNASTFSRTYSTTTYICTVQPFESVTSCKTRAAFNLLDRCSYQAIYTDGMSFNPCIH